MAGIISTIADRRSCRQFSAEALTPAEAADVIFAAAGVVGYKNDKHGNQYPLTSAPSGGACAPISVRIVARRVHGIPAGVYRYAPEAHQLYSVGKISGDEAEFLAHGQRWAAEAPLLICFVADVRKTMARYTGAAVYQAFPLEIGHRAQNVLLAATNLGLGTCVTAGADRKRASRRFQCDWPWESVLYLTAVGRPGADAQQRTDSYDYL
jgi:SagB-type dehydrogenase family enzyme